MTIKAVVFDAYGTLYDVQSVEKTTNDAFPGYGAIITQIWRLKQLEYTWLRTLMKRYEDFSLITEQSLAYTLRCLGLKNDPEVLSRIMDKYVHLDLYPDAIPSLEKMRDRKLAILSNGSTVMLTSLVKNTGLDKVLTATISIDSNRMFKPSPEAYTLIQSNLEVAPSEVLFVSSNPFDVCGAKSFGLRVAWIERVTAEAMAKACIDNSVVPPLTMFKALRMQMDELGFQPDVRVSSLSDIPNVLAKFS